MFAFSSPRPPVPADLVAKIRPTILARSRTLAVGGPWSEVIPEGKLRRGSTVLVETESTQGGVSVALSLAAEAMTEGLWAGVVGVRDPGVAAMVDLGLDLRRVLFVPSPAESWAESAADLLDGVDVLVVQPPRRAGSTLARRLSDRVRERGVVLVVVAGESTWPASVDLTLRVREAHWEATSRLVARALRLEVGSRDRGTHTVHEVILPDPRGRVASR
ncbi:MAG: hypothetical protein KGR42_03680 [Acidobacteria bacterium]|nr:hypothetical protein [Acidobacteriota bacterium]